MKYIDKDGNVTDICIKGIGDITHEYPQLNTTAKELIGAINENTASLDDITTQIKDFTYYNYFSQLNVEPTTATPVQIVDAMSDYSICMLNVGIANTGFYNNPYDYGTFIAYKINNSRVKMEFITLSTNRTYSAIRRKDDSNDFFSGWSETTQTDIVDQPLNSGDYVEQLISVAESYLKSNYWVYSTDTIFRTDNFTTNGKMNIDCSTFVQLALLGIRYEDSRYYNSALGNSVKNEYKWAYNFEKKESYYSYKMAEQFYKNGWEIKPFSDYSNLQRGDLVFWKRENPGREHMVAFRNIDHVALYYGKVNGVHKVIEVWVDGDVCRIQDLQDSREGRICMFARVPMLQRKNVINGTMPKFFSNGEELKIKKISGITSANLNIHVTSENLCDYDKVEIGSVSNTTGVDVTATNRLRTGYIPCNIGFGTYNNNSPSGFSLVFICYYDKDKNFLGTDGTNVNKFYMRRVYKYGADVVITTTELNLFRNNFIINFGGVLKPWSKGYSKEINITLPISSGNLNYNGNIFIELDTTTNSTINDKIKTLCVGGMTHIYTNQLNELTIEV